MYVEFFGLPASGKSTTLNGFKSAMFEYGYENAHRKYLEKRDYSNLKIPPLIRRNMLLRSVYRAEEFRYKYPKFVAVGDQLFQRDFATRALFMHNGENYLSYNDYRNASTFHVEDEGFVHRGIYWLARLHRDNADLFDQFFENLPKIDLIVYTKTDPETSYKRAIKRIQEKRDENASMDEIEKKIHRTLGSLEEFTICWEIMEFAILTLQEKGVKVITIDTSSDIDTAAAQVIGAVHDHIAALRKPPRSLTDLAKSTKTA